MSSWLFYTYLDEVVEEMIQNGINRGAAFRSNGVKCLYEINQLFFTDDTCLVVDSEKLFNRVFEKYYRRRRVRMNTEELEEVKEFE